VCVFIINLGTKFETRNSSALLVPFINATEMFFFYIQPKYCPKICSIFLQATLLYKTVELIKNGADDSWIKIVCVCHTDVAEWWKLEGKFTDVQHCHNVQTKVREIWLRNPKLSLVTRIHPRPQEHTHICLKEEDEQESKVCQWALQEHAYCKYMQLSSKTTIWPQFAVWNFSARHSRRTWVLIWRYFRYMLQGLLPWFSDDYV